MALCVSVGTSTTGTQATSYNTPSWAFSTDSLGLVQVASWQVSGSNTGPSSITGAGRTWVKVDEYNSTDNLCHFSLWRSLGASGSGALTINYAAQQNLCVASAVEWTGVDTTGTNGSGAVVQVAKQSAASGNPSVALAAFGSASNGTYAASGWIANDDPGVPTATAGTGLTELNDTGIQGVNFQTAAVWSGWASGNQSPAACTWTNTSPLSGVLGIIALEIRDAPSGPSITSINPTIVTAGGGNFTLTVNGSNFVSGSVVRVNGASRATTFVSASQVTATVLAADISSAATLTVTVFNTGFPESNGVTLIVDPVPTAQAIARSDWLGVPFSARGVLGVSAGPGSSNISGVSSLTFGTSASLTGAGSLSGVSGLTFSPVSALAGSGALSGASSLTFGTTAAIRGLVNASGVSSLTFTPVATISATAGAAGVSSLTFAVSGNLGTVAGDRSTANVGGIGPMGVPFPVDFNANRTGSVGDLSGVSSLTFGTAANLTGSGALSGSSSLTFGTTAALVGAGALSGASSLTFTPTATPGALAGVSGTSSLTFATTAVIAGSAALSGASSLTFGTSGAVAGSGALSGSSSLTFSLTASADLPSGAMSGTSSLTFASSGALVGSGALSGASSLTFGTSATIGAQVAISGASSLTFGTAGALAGDGALSGASSLTFDAAGNLTGIPAGAMSGNTSITFGVTGNLITLTPADSRPGGRPAVRAAIVYRARYRGEVYEFATFEELEAWYLQTQRNEQARPKRKRAAVKIELPPETVDDLAPYDFADKPVIPKLDLRQSAEAIAQVRKLIERKKREAEEDEELLLWLM